MSPRPRVVVAMSGGVDSSVAAALLKQQGCDVIGMMMRLWSEPGKEDSNRCCTPDAMAQARRVAAMLDIPFYSIDARDVFQNTVVDYFIDGYAQGETPNPCLVCNRQIRWEFLLNHAFAMDAQFMATGHYARVQQDPGGLYTLLRGVDPQKDQSYILHILTQQKLRHALFPLGAYTKPQVRQLARDFNLPVAERSESQDLCFLGDEDYRKFLQRNAAASLIPGDITTPQGIPLGRHNGLAFYTIGQRKGLNLSSPVPMYVVAKDLSNNRLVVDSGERRGQREFFAGKVNWISGSHPAGAIQAQVKIRYKSRELQSEITPLGPELVRITVEEPLTDITPGQAAVFFDGEICLGGGIIQQAVNIAASHPIPGDGQ